jgi:hypothetical protein
MPSILMALIIVGTVMTALAVIVFELLGHVP